TPAKHGSAFLTEGWAVKARSRSIGAAWGSRRGANSGVGGAAAAPAGAGTRSLLELDPHAHRFLAGGRRRGPPLPAGLGRYAGCLPGKSRFGGRGRLRAPGGFADG